MNRMSVNFTKYFKFIIDYCRGSLEPLLPGYTSSLTVKDITQEEPIRLLEILFTSEAFNRSLLFEFSEGRNINGKIYNSLQFTVLLNSPNKKSVCRDYFLIGDYYKFRKIERNLKGYFFTDGRNFDEKKIVEFIAELKSFLEEDEIRILLSSNEWIEVPQDRSMYF